MKEDMKKRNRLKKNEDFQKVFKKGKSMANRQYVLYVLHQPEAKEFRVGLSVSKKIGNAVVRNRVKRLIRQVIQEERDLLKQENDYIIIARKPAADLSYEETKKSLQHLFRKSFVYRKKPNQPS
ncbi:Ribonuclease P protein component [Bacillus paralicheniformis]|nr:Ribonuclease P protein component [Bacillus paralicheniformis]